MATKMMTRGMSAVDRLIAGAMMMGLVAALVECAHLTALPAHFV